MPSVYLKLGHLVGFIIKKIPTIVRNGPLARPEAEGATHTSSGNQSSTANQKQSLYMTVSRTSRPPTNQKSN